MNIYFQFKNKLLKDDGWWNQGLFKKMRLFSIIPTNKLLLFPSILLYFLLCWPVNLFTFFFFFAIALITTNSIFCIFLCLKAILLYTENVKFYAGSDFFLFVHLWIQDCNLNTKTLEKKFCRMSEDIRYNWRWLTHVFSVCSEEIKALSPRSNGPPILARQFWSWLSIRPYDSNSFRP